MIIFYYLLQIPLIFHFATQRKIINQELGEWGQPESWRGQPDFYLQVARLATWIFRELLRPEVMITWLICITWSSMPDVNVKLNHSLTLCWACFWTPKYPDVTNDMNIKYRLKRKGKKKSWGDILSNESFLFRSVVRSVFFFFFFFVNRCPSLIEHVLCIINKGNTS